MKKYNPIFEGLFNNPDIEPPISPDDQLKLSDEPTWDDSEEARLIEQEREEERKSMDAIVHEETIKGFKGNDIKLTFEFFGG